jgi:hypothetical protein
MRPAFRLKINENEGTRFAPKQVIIYPCLWNCQKFYEKRRTYKTTEVAEKHSVSSKEVEQKAETSGGGK